MKLLVASIVALVGVVLVPALPVSAETQKISQQELLERLEKQDAPLVLDVRSAKEFETGRVPGAKNVPLQLLRASIERLRSEATGGDREVVVYCERGGRAAMAESMLIEAGFAAVKHLEGDMSGWRSASLPVEGPEDADTPE